MAHRKIDQEMIDAYDAACTVGGGYAHLYGLRAVHNMRANEIAELRAQLAAAEEVAKAAVRVVDGWPDALKLDENDTPIENNEQAARCDALEAAIKAYRARAPLDG